MKREIGVDIIVPVYNALEDLKLCVESVKKYTDLTVDRLVLIDDQSPDPNVYPFMKSIEQPGIVVLQNEKNQGFSGTINRGMQYSHRDVLLLNSDTVVTAGWMDKIVACAYSDPAIATVTPFSNNATLCSIPNFCQENEIPYGLSIDAYAEVIEHCSMKVYPRITVAVGFCMFIKREVVDAVGLFDQETFQRGYGEENDFCWRAEQLGYYHALCDDTYIYHSGSSSFLSEEKKKLIAEHEQIIQNRYPTQNQRNSEYVRDNPHQYLRENVDIYARLKNGKKNILYVMHTDFRTDANNNIGGTQFHVKDLVMHMRRENNVFVLARDGKLLRLTVYLQEEQFTLAFYIGANADFQQFTNKEIAGIFREILVAFSVDLVHVQHVAGMSFDVFTVAKELGIPLVATIHDFFYLCPTIKLLENGVTFCHAQGENCAHCLQSQMGLYEKTPYLAFWREKCRHALSLCDALAAPSEAVKRIFAAVYPELAQRMQVVPHGIDPFCTGGTSFREVKDGALSCFVESAFQNDYIISGWAYREDWDSRYCQTVVCLEDGEGNYCEYQTMPVGRPDVAQAKSNTKYLYSGFQVQIPDGYFASGTLKLQLIIRYNGEEVCSEIIPVQNYVKREKKNRRIAFLGGLSETKGSKTAYQMIKQSGNQYDWYIIGGIGDANLVTLEKSNVFKTDWYKRENICAILQQNQIDMVCILPTCPETFCYTLSESQLAGVPILAADIGALGDRLRADQTGWLVSPHASAKEILSKMGEIFREEDSFRQMRENTEKFCHKTIGQMCSDYTRIYDAFAIPEHRERSFDTKAMYNAYIRCQLDGSGATGTMDGDLVRRVHELEATLSRIQESLEYRMVRFFNRETLPFKRQIKWLIGFAYRVYVKLFRR